jgi:hypothetical protein
MLFAFLDESYTDQRYYIGAVVVPVDNLNDLSNAVKSTQEYAEGFGIAPKTELHAHRIMNGTGEWKALHGQHRAALAIYRRALANITVLPITILARGVDVGRLNARYSYPQPPYHVTLQHLLERIDEHARRRKEQVTVIADEIRGQADHVARTMTYQITGTRGYRSSTLDAIQMPIVYGPSHESPGVQAADLVTYLYRRKDAHQETNPKAAQAVEDLWRIIAPKCRSVSRWDP